MADNNDALMQAYVQMLMRDPGTEGLQQQVSAFDALGPEGYKQIVESNTLGQRSQLARQNAMDQSAALEPQMAMAQALSQPKGKNYGTVGGNVAGGIGDALGAFFGGMKMRNLGQEQAGLLSKGNA